MTAHITLIENCDFDSWPVGGQVSWMKSILRMFPNHCFALVGTRADSGPVGRWTFTSLAGRQYPFLAVGRRRTTAVRPIVPERLRFFAELRLNRRVIQSRGLGPVMIAAPETLLAVRDWGWASTCYTFSGVDNPLEVPRYKWARCFARIFDYLHFKCAADAEVLFAHAEREAIRAMAERSGGCLREADVMQVSSAFDEREFAPADSAGARSSLGLPSGVPIFLFCGRISFLKGWDLVLNAFESVRVARPESLLLFLGDGEDFQSVRRLISERGLDSAVRLCGFHPARTVAAYMNAADAVVFGSRREGWCTAMVEALACGKRIVSTDVGAARSLVADGVNGYVLRGREPKEFGAAMIKVLSLPKDVAAEYSVSQGRCASSLNVAAEMRRALPYLR